MNFVQLAARLRKDLDTWGPGLVELRAAHTKTHLQKWIADMNRSPAPRPGQPDPWRTTVKPAVAALLRAFSRGGSVPTGPALKLHRAICDVVLPDALLAKLPFAGDLKAALDTEWTRVDGVACTARLHTLWALDALHRLRGQALDQAEVGAFADGSAEVTTTLRGMVRTDLDKAAQDLRFPVESVMYCLVLYHDIGRRFGEERHAVNGYNLLALLSKSEEREGLRAFLEPAPAPGTDAPGDSILRLFLRLMRYHDLTGTVVTGEASLAALGQALQPEQKDRAAHKLLLAALCLVNLADYAAGWFRAIERPADYHERIGLYLRKLSQALDAFPAAQRLSRQDVFAALLGEAQGETAVIDRLEDLAKTSRFPCTRGHLADALALVSVGDAEGFYQSVASIGKLDYGKRFFDGLAKRLQAADADPRWPADRQAEALVRIVYRISKRYEGFAHQQTLIGINMTGLDPRQPYTQRLLDLFVSDPDRALVAIEDQVSAFPFA